MSDVIDLPERQRYLADPHVGVLSVAITGDRRRTLAVPIWYGYTPDTGVSVITGLTSRKGAAIQSAGRYGLAAQTEEIPYKYVSVEGPVIEVRPCELERDLLPMAVRYLGSDAGERYADYWRAAETGDDHVFVMDPQHWKSADFTSDFVDLESHI